MKQFLPLLFLLGLCRPLEATISCSLISRNENTTDATSFVTSSVTPTGGSLQVLFIVNTKASAPDEPSTVSGDGLTFAKLHSKVSTADDERIGLWYAQAASPTTGTVTVNYGGGNTQTHFLYSWMECTGTTGTNGNNGADAFNSNFADNVGTAVTSLTVTLSAFASPANGAVCGVGLTTNTAITGGSGWTENGTSTGGATPNARIHSEWRATSDTSADMTFSSANAVGIAAELLNPLSIPVLFDHYKRMMSFIFWRLPSLCGLLFS
jgi:hypothetical protein